MHEKKKLLFYFVDPEISAAEDRVHVIAEDSVHVQIVCMCECDECMLCA